MKKSLLIKIFMLLCIFSILSVSSIGVSSFKEQNDEDNYSGFEKDFVDIPSCGQIRIYKPIAGMRARFYPAFGGGLRKYINRDDFKGLYFGCDLRIYEGSYVEIRGLREQGYTIHKGPLYFGLDCFHGEVHQDYDWGSSIYNKLGKIYEMSGYYFGTMIKP